ncbi:MAG: restriction endonuclease [Deltaproteobacteria bacterium]|nr:restriction endonuclease [Deltaproteobacteria bacterium]
MAIPDYETIMLPLLNLLSAGEPMSLDEATNAIAAQFKLTSDEQAQRIPSGQSTYVKNRVGWARTYLKKAGLLQSPKRGYVQITDRGSEVLGQRPKQIDQKFLRQFPEFMEFVSPSGEEADKATMPSPVLSDQTPDEVIARSYQTVRSQLSDELLDTIKGCSPAFFEKLVIDLLVAMGYGGTAADAARATQLSNDEGIDGVIKEDKLGLDTIYVQAKRWQNPVHRPEIQKFAGALQGKRSRKGIFITTSTFSDGAKEFASTIESHIVFIDGMKLAELMIDHGVGVATQKVYEMKKIDSDYFSEES